jgi:hypothetical protein
MFMTEVLTRCSVLEQRAAEIYSQFGSSLPDEKAWENFWAGMVAEEQRHAKILAAEKAALEVDSATGYFLPEFPAKLVKLDMLLTRIEAQARKGVSKEEMFELALQLEQSELDTIYRELAPMGRAAVKLMAQRLDDSLALPAHQQELLEGVKRFLPIGPVRQKVEAWATQQQRAQEPKP